MHLLVIVVVALIGIYFLTRPRAERPDTGDDVAVDVAVDVVDDIPGLPQIAFVSRGRLYCRAPGEAAKQVHSQFAQASVDRVERSKRLHGWKQGTAFETSFLRRAARQGAEAVAGWQFSSAQIRPDGKLIYFLRDGLAGGLFEADPVSGKEQRLLHRQRLNLEDLCLRSDGARLLASQIESNGTATIVAIDADGSNYQELTSGDTVDASPAFVPDREGAIVFESAGLARSPAGFPLARGPSSIQLLDAGLTTVVEHPRFDFLRPRVAPNGDLYYIRRPYEPPRYGPGAAIVDALLFPFRLLRALFHYLNFFSLMYSRKPLTSATGPEVEVEMKDILLKGKRLDAEAALRNGIRIGGVPSLVPASWQLIRRNRTGAEQVVASHVVSYDIGADGAIVFSNGFGAFHLRPDARPRLVLKHRVISELVVG